MFEWLRKLTTDYTEEEYNAWLFSHPMTDEQIDEWCAAIPGGIKTPREKEELRWNKAASRYVSKYGNINFCDKDEVAEALAQVADDTGYTPEFIGEMFFDALLDGEEPRDAFYNIAIISYEKDW